MAKAARINPDQGSLFVLNEHSREFQPDRALSVVPGTVANHEVADANHDPNPGPSVDILERNAHLQTVLKRLGLMSRNTGLQIASQTGIREKLRAQYDDVDRVVAGAANKSQERHGEARREFAHAFGEFALANSGLSPDASQAESTESFRSEFLPVFADAKGKNSRDRMKSWLNYQERTLKGKRTRRPKAPRPTPPKVV